MQFLTEYIPIIIFILAYFNGGIFFATKALMIAMPVGFLIQWALTKKINKIYLGSTLLVIILGTATIIFKNPTDRRKVLVVGNGTCINQCSFDGVA